MLRRALMRGNLSLITRHYQYYDSPHRTKDEKKTMSLGRHLSELRLTPPRGAVRLNSTPAFHSADPTLCRSSCALLWHTHDLPCSKKNGKKKNRTEQRLTRSEQTSEKQTQTSDLLSLGDVEVVTVKAPTLGQHP